MPEENEPANVQIEIEGINFKKHKSDQSHPLKLTSKAAQQIYSENKPAATIRRKLIAKNSRMFYPSTGRIMTANAVRCWRSNFLLQFF